MQFSIVAVAVAIAGSAAAQTTAGPSIPDSSFYSVFKTGVPSSIQDLIVTNPASASTLISNGYTSGTSFWAGSFPADVQSSLRDPNWRATNQVFNNPALLTATTPVTYPTTPFRSSAPAQATGSGAPGTEASASASASRSGAASVAFTGGAPAATGAVGAGVALAAGIAGMLAM